MTFTGTPTITEVSDGLVRITGLSLAAGALGTIGLHESIGTPDVRLPAPFRPRDYGYPGTQEVALQDSVQVWWNVLIESIPAPVAIQKGGTTPLDFVIAMANMSQGAIGLLGRAQSFGILAGQSVANVGATVELGDVGISPGSTITGFPPGAITGTLHAGDAAAANAQADAAVAFSTLRGMAVTQVLSGNLGGLTLTPGIYRFAAGATLTGTLTLDAQNDPNGVFVFQMETTFTIAAGGTVSLINSAVPQNVFWRVATNVTAGANAVLSGTFLAGQSITMGNGATLLNGSLFALAGSVTLDTNAIAIPSRPEVPGFGSGPLEIYVRFH